MELPLSQAAPIGIAHYFTIRFGWHSSSKGVPYMKCSARFSAK